MAPVENQPQTPSLTLGSVWISIRTGPIFLCRFPKWRKRHERNSINVKQTICRFFAGFLRQKRGVPRKQPCYRPNQHVSCGRDGST